MHYRRHIRGYWAGLQNGGLKDDCNKYNEYPDRMHHHRGAGMDGKKKG